MNEVDKMVAEYSSNHMTHIALAISKVRATAISLS